MYEMKISVKRMPFNLVSGACEGEMKKIAVISCVFERQAFCDATRTKRAGISGNEKPARSERRECKSDPTIKGARRIHVIAVCIAGRAEISIPYSFQAARASRLCSRLSGDLNVIAL